MRGAPGPEAWSWRGDPAVPAFDDSAPVLVFDGHCVLCSASARFVLRHDRAGAFRFLAAQSPLGQALYVHFGLDPAALASVLLLDRGRPWTRSDAALAALRRLGGPWAVLAWLRLIPRPLRDGAYDLIARHRYRLFGRRAACDLPDPARTPRLLEPS